MTRKTDVIFFKPGGSRPNQATSLKIGDTPFSKPSNIPKLNSMKEGQFATTNLGRQKLTTTSIQCSYINSRLISNSDNMKVHT